ncbi:MAG: M1 family aminopeptidase [Deltaproteobacteria bacterium]
MDQLRLLLVVSILLLTTSTWLGAQSYQTAHFPHYSGKVHFSLQQKRLEGNLRIRIPKSAQGKELLLALPMNRFAQKDTRGLRRPRETPIFAKTPFSENDDPLLPSGFSPGSTEIKSVLNGTQPLKYQLEANPALENGYSVEHGLLRILNEEEIQEIEIEFQTNFPERYQEGIVDGILMSALWYPQLLIPKESGWDTRLDLPSPGTFEIEWSSEESGQLISTPLAAAVTANKPILLPKTNQPLTSFPLIFGEKFQKHEDAPLVESFYQNNYERRVGLIHGWTEEFVAFVGKRYSFRPTWDELRIVQVPGRSEDVTVWNNVIMVPQPHYERSELLDRRVMGLLSMKLGRIWFGSTLWNDEDTQMWLSHGLPTFLSLRFYEHKYGKNGGIFDFINWMNPEFREHFIEEMARNNNLELLKPIVTSFRENPATQAHLRAVNYKAASVISMLEYEVGEKAFLGGLQNFVREGQQKVVTHNDLRSQMEIAAGKDLDWFFKQWFETIERLDYAVGETRFEELPNGEFLIRVEVQKLGDAEMPLEVLLRTEDEKEHRQKIFSQRPLYIVEFRTQSPPDEVSLDPDEFLLETSRVNNHSFTFFRIRFAFDWHRQRERLITFVPGFTNNAVDGNSFGVGLRHREGDTSIYAIPGYGTRSGDVVYQLDLKEENFIKRNYFGQLLLERVGGVVSNGIFLGFSGPRYPDQPFFDAKGGIALEYLYSTAATSSGDTGNSNVMTLQFDGWNRDKGDYLINLKALAEQPSQELDTKYSYTLLSERLTQIFVTGFRSNIRWEVVLGNTLGDSPSQKKYSLGGPKSLRGFPQAGSLQQDNYLLTKVDYEFPLITTPLWGNVSSLGLQGTVFFDQGRGWGNELDLDEAKDRRNVGVGIRWGVDAASLIQIPLKFEIAYPVGDQDYRSPQFIFFGVLTGS